MEENIGNFGFGNIFSDVTPKTQSMKEKNWLSQILLIKNCSAKDTGKKISQVIDWEKIHRYKYIGKKSEKEKQNHNYR